MQRIAFLMYVKEGYQEEYRRRHRAVWPELLADLKKAGAHNYSIYLHGTQLFAYMEVEDFDRFVREMARSEANRRWQEYMAPIMEIPLDPETGFPRLLEEVFHLD